MARQLHAEIGARRKARSLVHPGGPTGRIGPRKTLSHHRLEAAVEASRLGFWEENLATGACYYSPGWKAQLGYSGDEIGSSFEEWNSRIHPDDRERVLRLARKFKSGETAEYDIEFRLRHKDGTYRWIHSRAALVTDLDGRSARMIGTHVDLTERKEAEAELVASHDRLRDLSARLQAARAEERARISRQIHDDLGQRLTAMNMDLAWIAGKLPSQEITLANRIASAIGNVHSMMDAVRSVANELRPATFNHGGLAGAIISRAKEFELSTGIHCALRLPRENLELAPEQMEGVLQVVKEALTNVARHAGAREVLVRLKQCGKHVKLQVSDNGRGIAEEQLADRRALGILGMRESAAILGGDLAIMGQPGRGTTVTLRIPLADPHS